MTSFARSLPLLLALVQVPTVSASSQVDGSPGQPRDSAQVHVLITRVPGGTAGQIVLLVRVEATGLTLGSYSGTLQFDPAVLAIDSATVGRDGSRFVNAGESGRGMIRFAGFTTNGFGGTEAVRLVGRLRPPGATAHVTGKVEVAGSLEGRTVPAAFLRGTRIMVSGP